MEINIQDYLTHDEIKEIAIEQVKGSLRQGGERLVNNLAYEVAFRIIDESLTDEMMEQVKNKVPEIIDGMSEFSIFRKPNAWERQSSDAWDTLQTAMKENRDSIKDKVKETIENYNYESALTRNSDFFTEMIVEVLREGLKGRDKA